MTDTINPSVPDAQARTGGKVAVLVLGMHRSGTSLLGGLLEQLGCKGAKSKLAPSQWNPKGYFESPSVMNVNDAILDALGSRWDDWSPLDPGWQESPRFNEFRARIGEVMDAEYGDASLVYVKDPRICRLLPIWREALETAGYAPVCIHTHRTPSDVSRSLQVRDSAQVDPGLGVLLWLRHVLDAEVGSRGLPRVFTSYEQLLSNWTGFSDRAEQILGFRWPVSTQAREMRVQEMLDPTLRHHHTPYATYLANSAAPNLARDCLRILEEWAEKGEAEAERQELSLIRARFDASGALFVRPIAELSKRAQRVKTAEAERNAADECAKKYEAEVEGLRIELVSLQRQAEEGRQALTAEIQHLTDQLTAITAERAELYEKAASLESVQSHARVLKAERDTLIEQTSNLQKNLDQANSTAADERATAEAQRAKLQAELKELVDKVIERDKAAVALRKEVDEASRDVAKANDMIREHEKALANLESELVDANSGATSAAAEAKLLQAKLQGKITELTDKSIEHEKTIIALRNEIVDRQQAASLHLKRVASAYDEEVRKLHLAYRSSASWRYAAPIRAVGSLFKR